MNSYLRFAGTAGLCAALLLAACAKKTDQTTTSSDTTQSATASATDVPIASDSASPSTGEATTATAAATTTPAVSSTTSAGTTTATTTSGSNGSGSGSYIDLPVYPGASEVKDQDVTMSANGTSVVMKVYSTKDDAKTVADWYKGHLPASFKGGVLTSGDNTVGTFSQEHLGSDEGDQSVIVGTQSDKTTRIQLTTKHGK